MAGCDVLIVGAGPTGLVLALWLTRLGVSVRIIDRTAEPATTSRALAVQARTLEFYRQLGLADAIVARGREVAALNLWVSRRRVAHAVLGDMGAGISPYAYAFIYPQDDHERFLIDCLAELGVTVDRRTELKGFEEKNDGIVARLERADGAQEVFEAAFIAGCDGAHSRVRESLAVGFAGGTYQHLFYVADVDGSGSLLDGGVHVALDRADFLALFPLVGAQRARLVGTVSDAAVQHDEQLGWDDVGKTVLAWLPIDVGRVNWFSTYRVHHRVADRFRVGRAFLLGDAAHIHSPVGGQGMNTGIGDAVNLAWKLAAVLGARADERILDTYEPERIAFARRLVRTTDRAFSAVTSSTASARLLRLYVVPMILPALARVRAFRRFAFRVISQTGIHYRHSALSQGTAGQVHSGDRLPWVELKGTDNFAPLASLDWQLHVYGVAAPELRAFCEQRGLALHEFGWLPKMKKAGFAQNALYLVRPDGYVGFASEEPNTIALEAYLRGSALRAKISSPKS